MDGPFLIGSFTWCGALPRPIPSPIAIARIMITAIEIIVTHLQLYEQHPYYLLNKG